jgi:hypothetical protein
MKKLVGVIAVSFVGVAWATLPPPPPEARRRAAEAAAKAAGRQGRPVQALRGRDRIADGYRRTSKRRGARYLRNRQQCVDRVLRRTGHTVDVQTVGGGRCPFAAGCRNTAQPAGACRSNLPEGAKGG